MQTQQSSQELLRPEEILHWKTPQLLQNFEEELMKQANHQRAVEMSTYMAMAKPNRYRPGSASQPSTMMSATAAMSQPESSASAMAASQGPSMPLRGPCQNTLNFFGVYPLKTFGM